MKILLLILPVYLHLFSGTLTGQTIGVRTLALEEKATEFERYVKTAKGLELLVFLSRDPGVLVKANVKDSVLLLYKKIVRPGEEPDFQAVQQLKLPLGAKSVLILAWSEADGNERYLVVDDKFLDAGYNDWLMINAASKTIGLQVGKNEKPYVIKSNSVQICKVAGSEGKGAAVLGVAKLDNETKTFYSTYWPIREGERSIVIFFEQEDRVRVKKISDSLFKPKSRNPETEVGTE